MIKNIEIKENMVNSELKSSILKIKNKMAACTTQTKILQTAIKKSNLKK